ncbi:MAG: PqqD family protein [Candidatus Cloacimonetes bacterium]|nr:PqqD family protein [Candidatus Cloacimonadota bacterium]
MNTELIKNLAMNDNGFIFDPSSGYSYSANELGIYILRLLNEGQSKEEIIATIAAEYEVTPDNISSDIDHYFLMLESLDLLEL